MGRQLTINWVVPEPSGGAGGDIGLFRMARYLAEFGHRCRVYVVPFHSMFGWSRERITDFVTQEFGETPAEYALWRDHPEPADCTIATFWRTIEQVVPVANGGRKYYLVQDFEPWFYPMSLPNLRAENTYRLGLHCLTLGRWLAKFLRQHYGAEADFFDFGVDLDTYRPAQCLTKQRRICFYARPATPRRCYEMGLAALRDVHRMVPETEIILFGSRNLDPEPSFPFTDAGLVTHHELAALFRSCRAGLVFSLTNPSFIPLEMAACGCAVVEMKSERMEGVLTHDEDALLVDLGIAAVAEGCRQLLTDDNLHERIAMAGIRNAAGRDWQKSARQIDAVLLHHAG
jgi:glycosyltransferase involved in cell wall biosynthesis